MGRAIICHHRGEKCQGCNHYLGHSFVCSYWLPLPENVNALPQPIRDYIHDLETNADPAGMVAENALIKDLCKQLDAKIAELKESLYARKTPT